ncbi:unnamed protein product [Sphenostylis stenocarpa]|uniref:Uncharacterized protein n=1 Tax=Sphenostylis stenocarpa TaxID=92480 RepID=A0AA86T6T6_9FABA|nr:unnamed protein product [Sphenostylis stenocarpa]
MIVISIDHGGMVISISQGGILMILVGDHGKSWGDLFESLRFGHGGVSINHDGNINKSWSESRPIMVWIAIGHGGDLNEPCHGAKCVTSVGISLNHGGDLRQSCCGF